MDGLAADEAVDVARLDDFQRKGQGGAFLDAEPGERVPRRQHAPDFAHRVVERGAHRVQPVKAHQTVGHGGCLLRRVAAPVGAAQARIVTVFRGAGFSVVAHAAPIAALWETDYDYPAKTPGTPVDRKRSARHKALAVWWISLADIFNVRRPASQQGSAQSEECPSG